MYQKHFKRLFDIIISLSLIIILCPIILLLSFSVFIFIGYPIIFKQLRPGLNGKLFSMYKFRTMKTMINKNTILNDEDRLTKFGQFLRSISLDIPGRKMTALVGQSGAGKSILLKCLIGLVKPDSGTIYIDNKLKSPPIIIL